MRTRRFAQLILLICCLAISPWKVNAHAGEHDLREYILILNAYTDSSPWSQSIVSDIVDQLEQVNDVDVFTEHLGLPLIEDQTSLDLIRAMIASIRPEQAPRAVVMIGTPTIIFRDDIRRIWGDVPQILCSEEEYFGPDEDYLKKRPIPIDDRRPIHNLSQSHNLTMLFAPAYLEENIELLQSMIPNMRRVIFLGDGRYTNRQIDADLRDVLAQKFPELEYTFYSASEMSLEMLFDALGTIDTATTGVLFSSWHYRKQVGSNTLLIVNSDKLVSNTPVPLFGLNPTAVEDNGIVGGYVYNADNYSRRLIETLNQVLGGTPARKIPFYLPSDDAPVFNYPSLVRKNLSPESCPADSVFYDKPTSFLDRNKWLLLGGVGLLVLLVLFQQWRISVARKIKEVRTQEAKSQAKYSTLFNNMPILYTQVEAVTDDQGQVTDTIYRDVNACFERNVLPKSQIMGRRGSDFSPGSETDFKHFMNIILKEGRTISFPSYNDRNDTFYEVIMSRSYLPGHIDIFCLDSTALHRTQQKLSAINHKLSMALEVANIIPWKLTLEEHIIQCDMTHTEGHSGDAQLSIPEQEYFATIHKQDRSRVNAAYRKLIEGHSPKVQEEYRIVWRHNGKRSIEWVEVKAAVDMRDESGKPLSLVGSSLIITQRKELEMELLSARDRAEQSNRLKSAFLANMSHEIRTPLNAIVGFSSMLATTDEQELKQEYLGIIENNNTLLLQLISDILDLSKIEAGTLEFEYSDFVLDDLMREKENIMRMRLKTDKVQLVFEPGAPGCFIRSERNRLSQLLINLLTNAVKFTQEGSIRFGYELRGEQIYFYVTDTGCGIPERMQAQIFERFVKVDTFKQGTGLGLSICRTIVEKMDGQLGVESEEGKGSTFWFTLPYNPGKLPEMPGEELEPEVVEKDKLTILIAEDNASNYRLFETVLHHDYRLLHAWNGREAVELFKQHRPHIILMDINMPEMNGYEATAEIRKLSPHTPILAVTAYAYASDEQRVMESGFSGYMSKPINPKQLRSKLLDLLRKHMRII